ncbi:MAG: hypothetical protein ACQER4_10135 [Bacteroidota bacterium]
MNTRRHILATVSAVAMAVWLSAGLFHPVMQAHPQPNLELTEGLSHNHVLLGSHPICPLCFGVIAVPSTDVVVSVIRTLQFEQPVPIATDVSTARKHSPFSNRAPPHTHG